VPPASRLLKVFLASPSDVVEEREALARLVRDINDVLAYLTPEKRLSLELVRYETHSFPDLGPPQQVINRQIPLDYDIFIGLMWRRCGTPTDTSPSGTIEEFRRACEKRKQGQLPRIMFYFCEQMIPIPDAAELNQLAEVVKFREELASLGLTSTYPSHSECAEHVRGDLLRAIRDILHQEAASAAVEVPTERASSVDAGARSEILKLAEEYEETRRTMTSGSARTRRMTAIFSRMKAKAASILPLVEDLKKSNFAGQRLAAIATLQMFPQTEHMAWLAERLDNPEVERPFVGYQAAVAILEAVRALPPADCAQLKSTIEKARTLAGKMPGDPGREQVLQLAEEERSRKCSGSD
jgi:hypothetical protein